MKLRRSAQPPVAPTGRRRPTTDGTESRTAVTQAFSYHSQRSASTDNTGRRGDGESAAPRGERQAASVAQRFTRVLTAIGIVAALSYALYMSPNPRVTVSGSPERAQYLQNTQVYQQAATEALSGSVLNRIKLTVDTSHVVSSLQQSYPELQRVSVRRPLLQPRPVVVIEPYQPSFILTTTRGTAFLLDDTGRALTSASQVADVADMGILTLHDTSGLDVRLGGRALPTSTVSFAQTVVAALRAAKLDVTTLTLSSAYQLDVTIAGTPGYVKFNDQADALQQAGAYLALRDRLAQDRIVPAEYVDVRVLGRAYYK